MIKLFNVIGCVNIIQLNIGKLPISGKVQNILYKIILQETFPEVATSYRVQYKKITHWYMCIQAIKIKESA
jgi:hypothetical protein